MVVNKTTRSLLVLFVCLFHGATKIIASANATSLSCSFIKEIKSPRIIQTANLFEGGEMEREKESEGEMKREKDVCVCVCVCVCV